MRAFIIDDEIMAVELMSLLLNQYDDIDVVGKFTDPRKALEKMAEKKPDVIFLDIEMGKISGLEFAQELIALNDVEIVFTTAYSQYAIHAFELYVIDYLLKPIQEKRLEKTIQRLREKIAKKNGDKKKNTDLYIQSFGYFELMDAQGKAVIKWRTQKVKELLAYLWFSREKPVQKSVILENVFPDKDVDRATALLHTTVYQLRKSLKELGHPKAIQYVNEAYQLDLSLESDTERLNALLMKETLEDKELLEILSLYRGDFMEREGFHWSMGFQKLQQETFLNFLNHCAKSRAEEGIFDIILKQCLDKLYTIDSFSDNTAEQLMHYFAETGARYQLKDFFIKHCSDYRKELGLEPSRYLIHCYADYLDG